MNLPFPILPYSEAWHQEDITDLEEEAIGYWEFTSEILGMAYVPCAEI